MNKGEILTIDGKFYKKCQIIMLPAKIGMREKFTGVVKALRDVELYNEKYKENQIDYGLDWKHYYLCAPFQPQHLYILSDEEVKEGDWTHSNLSNSIFKMQVSRNVNFYGSTSNRIKYFRKIIATTDPALRIESTIRSTNESDYGKQLFILPRLSDPFIKKYCELGGISEVLVEYVEIYDKETTVGFLIDYKLKVAPDNTITIKEYKEKTYTVAEVVELFELERKHRDKYHHFVDTEDLPNWIKKQILV